MSPQVVIYVLQPGCDVQNIATDKVQFDRKISAFPLVPNLIRQAPGYTVRRKFSEDIFPRLVEGMAHLQFQFPVV